MTVTHRWPEKGDPAIELRAAGRTWETDTIGALTTIRTVTQTMVITADGGRYNRDGLFPVSEGRQSARKLVPPSDPRVLCVQGQRSLAELARQVENLARLERKDPMDVVAAYARIITETAAARNAFIALTTAASRAEQESER